MTPASMPGSLQVALLSPRCRSAALYPLNWGGGGDLQVPSALTELHKYIHELEGLACVLTLKRLHNVPVTMSRKVAFGSIFQHSKITVMTALNKNVRHLYLWGFNRHACY